MSAVSSQMGAQLGEIVRLQIGCVSVRCVVSGIFDLPCAASLQGPNVIAMHKHRVYILGHASQPKIFMCMWSTRWPDVYARQSEYGADTHTGAVRAFAAANQEIADLKARWFFKGIGHAIENPTLSLNQLLGGYAA